LNKEERVGLQSGIEFIFAGTVIKNMYKILIPIDQNRERALTASQAVIDLPSAADLIEVVLLYVHEEFEVPGDQGMVKSEDFYEDLDDPESLNDAKALLEEHGVSVESLNKHGDPATQIIETAKHEKVDQIMMGGKKRSAVGKLVFGSVIQDVLLKTEKPVTVIMSE